MRKLSLSLLTLSLGVALLPLAQAATTPAQEHLLEQVRLGEASNREDLVRVGINQLQTVQRLAHQVFTIAGLAEADLLQQMLLGRRRRRLR